MNQSIGCGAMPFALPSDKAAGENATLLPGSNSASNESEANFSEVLDSEIQDDAKLEKDASQVEPWAVYGIASITVQFPPAAVAFSISTTEEIEGVSQLPDESTVQDQADLLPAHLSRTASIELVNEAHIQRNEDAMKMRLETLKLAEQKVPSLPEGIFKSREQIAENPSEPAKIAYGMVAAQGALMVSESQ